MREEMANEVAGGWALKCAKKKNGETRERFAGVKREPDGSRDNGI
jgi:hypothetical protein